MLNTNNRLCLKRETFYLLAAYILFPRNVRHLPLHQNAPHMPFTAPRWPSTWKLEKLSSSLRYEMRDAMPILRTPCFCRGKSGLWRAPCFLIARYRPLFRHVESVKGVYNGFVMAFHRELLRHWCKNFAGTQVY